MDPSAGPQATPGAVGRGGLRARRAVAWLATIWIGVAGATGALAQAPPEEPVIDDPVLRAEAAAKRAEAAADEAARIARAAAERDRAERQRTRRSGPYVGGAFFYAAENFDDSVIVKSSTGGAAFLGYRIDEMFAFELRYEGFDGFELRGRTTRSEIDGYAITAIGRFFPLAGPIQPCVSVGVGGARFEQKTVFGDGSRRRGSESDAAFRFGGGLDIWLNAYAVLNLEAAYLAPLDDLSDLDSVLLSSGLTLRF